jgi:hypothetical protein
MELQGGTSIPTLCAHQKSSLNAALIHGLLAASHSCGLARSHFHRIWIWTADWQLLLASPGKAVTRRMKAAKRFNEEIENLNNIEYLVQPLCPLHRLSIVPRVTRNPVGSVGGGYVPVTGVARLTFSQPASGNPLGCRATLSVCIDKICLGRRPRIAMHDIRRRSSIQQATTSQLTAFDVRMQCCSPFCIAPPVCPNVHYPRYKSFT